MTKGRRSARTDKRKIVCEESEKQARAPVKVLRSSRCDFVVIFCLNMAEIETKTPEEKYMNAYATAPETNVLISSPESILCFFSPPLIPSFFSFLRVAYVLHSLAAYIRICAAPAGSLIMIMMMTMTMLIIRMPCPSTPLFYFLLRYFRLLFKGHRNTCCVSLFSSFPSQRSKHLSFKSKHSVTAAKISAGRWEENSLGLLTFPPPCDFKETDSILLDTACRDIRFKSAFVLSPDNAEKTLITPCLGMYMVYACFHV